MARYFFVPGGKRGASDWDQVRAILEEQGHQTKAITLADPEHATLEGHVAEVRAALAAWGSQPVRLVGHSYASLVISGAAAARPEAIESLGFVDCLIPTSGRSLFDFFRQAGVDPNAFGVPAWPPFTQPLVFDEKAIQALPKLYVHCVRSQFLSLTRAPVRRVQAHLADEHWAYREIDADHYVMLEHAPELAAILEEM